MWHGRPGSLPPPHTPRQLCDLQNPHGPSVTGGMSLDRPLLRFGSSMHRDVHQARDVHPNVEASCPLVQNTTHHHTMSRPLRLAARSARQYHHQYRFSQQRASSTVATAAAPSRASSGRLGLVLGGAVSVGSGLQHTCPSNLASACGHCRCIRLEQQCTPRLQAGGG